MRTAGEGRRGRSARHRGRRLAAIAAALAVLASCTSAVPGGDRPGTGRPTGAASPDPGAGRPTTPAPADVLAGPDQAARVGAAAVLDAGRRAATGPWRDLGAPRWSGDAAGSATRPVYVGRATIPASRDRVRADLAVATRVPADRGRLVLRWLPAAAAPAGPRGLRVAASVDGAVVDPDVDRDGARLVVPLPDRERADGLVLVRLRLAYRIPEVAESRGGSAADVGLLARSAQVTTLGHWLPLLTLPGNRGPMAAWGDVGAFPVAVWSLRIHSPGTVITGGVETRCAGVTEPCVLARGTALRDLSAVVLDEVVTATGEAGGLAVRVAAAPSLGGVAPVRDTVVGAVGSFRRRFGPLAWSDLDTVAVPLGGAVAGMEFPGLSLVAEDVWDDLDGGFGTFVIAHEVAHQWFHALVGNGSLDSPVVDESLAQYLSVLYYRDALGADAARDLVERSLRGRYRRAVDAGVRPTPPARPVGAFAGSDAYAALVYGRAPLAWLAAEQTAGVDGVEAFLAAVVEEHGLAEISDDELLAAARREAPQIADALEGWWFSARAPDGA